MRWLDGITESMDMSLSKLQDSEGQGGLMCCRPWGHKELDTTEMTEDAYVLIPDIHCAIHSASPILAIQ